MVSSNPLCGRASQVKIKRKQITKKSLLRLKRPLRQKWLELEISKANISKAFLKLFLADKWLAHIVLALSIIQLLSTKGAWYGFNVPNRYLITQTKKYEHDRKYFLDKIKYLKNFEIILEYFQVCQWNTALGEKSKR